MSFPTKMSFKRIGDDPTALRVQKVCALLCPIVLRGFVQGVEGIGHKNTIFGRCSIRLQTVYSPGCSNKMI